MLKRPEAVPHLSRHGFGSGDAEVEMRWISRPYMSGAVLMLGAVLCAMYVPVMRTRDMTPGLLSLAALAEFGIGLMGFTLCGSQRWKLRLPEWLFACLEPMLPIRGGWRSKSVLGLCLLGVFCDPLLYLALGHEVSSNQHWFAIAVGLLASLVLAATLAIEPVRRR